MKKYLLKNSKIPKSNEGFTLIELLIYMAIFAILLTVLTQIFMTVLNVQLETESTSSVEQDSRFILARMMYDIQKASAIGLPAALGDQGNTLSLMVGGVPFIYSLNGTDLELSRDGASDKLNSFDTEISNLSFQRLGNAGGVGAVKIGFTVTSKAVRSSGSEVRNIQTVVGLRPN